MVRNNDGTGSLKIVQPLDYEDPLQSQGFRFRIQVNDKGDDNDNDKYHVAYAWVKVSLRDINDNKPQFEKPNIEVSVYENAEVGKSLETFKATDPDQGGKSKVSYAIDRTSDRKRQFSINQDGTVIIQRSLDREDTPRHQVSPRVESALFFFFGPYPTAPFTAMSMNNCGWKEVLIFIHSLAARSSVAVCITNRE